MIRNYLIALAFSLPPLVTCAESITATQAEITARQFFNSSKKQQLTTTADMSLQLVWQGPGRLSRSTAEPPFYVFNRGKNQGFVIIAGDNSVRPILAYAYEGSFCTQGMPDNLKNWALTLSQSIDKIRQNTNFPSTNLKALWENPQISDNKIIDLKTPDWDQTAPYNNDCPRYPNSDLPCLAGCVTAATSIVMGYHQWPKKGIGTLPEYYSSYYEMTIPSVKLGEEYQWKQMPELDGNPLDKHNMTQVNAVAKLIHHVSVMARSNFSLGATSASLSTVCENLPKYMGYRSDQLQLLHSHFSDSIWNCMVREEIEAGRPVIYEGYTGEFGMGYAVEGHAFVVDGYDGEFFNINWGWSGRSNGFYNLSNLQPGSQGSGGSTSGQGFSYRQGAIFRIQPLKEGDQPETQPELFYTLFKDFPTGLRIDSEQWPLKANQTFRLVSGRVQNLGHSNFDGEFSVVVTDANGKIKESLYTRKEDPIMPAWGAFPLFYNTDGIELSLTKDPEPGDRIKILSREKGTKDWKDIRCREANGKWEIILNDSPINPTPNPTIKVQTLAGSNLKGQAVVAFSTDKAVSPTDPNVQVYTAEAFEDNLIILRKLKATNNHITIPAQTGVILLTPTEQEVYLQPSTDSPVEIPSGNLLRPLTTEHLEPENGQQIFVLTRQNGEIIFTPTDKPEITTGSAYLISPTKAELLYPIFEDDDRVTEIGSIESDITEQKSLYDLSGRRIQCPQGIYISNGKKLIKK